MDRPIGRKATVERVRSGVSGLDGLLEGGFPKGSTVLVAGSTGSGKTILATQFIYNGANLYGEKGVYATFEEDRPSFERNMSRLGFDLPRLEEEGKVMILGPEWEVLREGGLDVNLQNILDKMEEIGGTRLVIDSLTALLSACEDKKLAYRSAAYLIHDQLKERGYTTLMTVSVPIGSMGLGMGVEEFMTDGVIQLENVVDGLEVRTRLIIRKMRGTDHSRKLHRVMFLPNGIEIVPFTAT